MHKMQPTSSCHSFLNRVDEIDHILRERIAILPGARDRENRPIIFVPARDIATNPDHIRNLMIYLYDVTSDDAKARGFVFIVDMRKGTSWDIVKPILKSLQEYFPANINCVYIIKPDKFIEKYKISTTKYTKFELQLISLDAIPKFVDFCQIIREFGGSLNYDNDEWIEFRREIEKIVHRMSEILKNLERISIEMRSGEMPLDAIAAQSSIQRHQGLFPIISAVPIEDFDRDIHQLRERVLISGSKYKNGGLNKKQLQQNGIVYGNPDLLFVFPHLCQLLKTLVRTRNDTMNQWEARKTELDHYSQLKLFEQDAENLSQWISKHFHSLTHRFVLIGENEQETSRLLKEHLDFADSVNKIEVSYSQALIVGKRLLEMQTVGINKIENISRQLKDNWTQFLTRIEQRTQLLKLASNAHRKCGTFLKNAEQWQMNVGIDPNSIISMSDLEDASKKHREFQKLYQGTYSEAYEEMNQLMKILKKYFGDSASQLPIYRQIQEQIQLITNTLKGIHSIWEARDLTIHNKISSADFVFDLQSVLDWLTQHGEPFLQRKVGIGQDPESANVLTQNHQKFRAVAINTHKNAEQIFRMIHVLDDAEEAVRSDALRKVEELRQRIDKFRRSIEHRTHLLHSAYYFYLHYDEIMEWYGKMDARAAYICMVPDSVEQCEKNKETFQTDNDLTVQAYDRVMIEAQQLLQLLKQQRELLSIDNNESMLHVQTLMRNIENRHILEKDRWQEQRVYLNTALKISTFLRDCFEIKKQLESWRQDLQGLRHSVSNTVEIIKQYHTQNTIKVQQVVSDAMKQLSEILELIQSKALRMVLAEDPNKPIDEVIVKAAEQLQNLEREVMNIAKDISNRIELNIQLGKLRHLAHEVVEAIEREQMRLLQFYHIPGNQQETDLEYKYFNEFRMEIELFEEKVSRFYNEKERFTALLALDSHAETRVRAENLLTEVKAKWQCLVGLLDTRNKLLTAANSYYKYTKLLLPTSQSIEKDLSADRDNDFCKSGNWNSLEHCFEATQERLEKHSNHRKRFLEASVYAQQTADQFMKFMQRCGAPKEHMDTRLIEVQQYKDAIRERQNIIHRLWTECNAKIEKCRDAVKIKYMARKVIDWTDRELATCVKIIDTAEHIRKFEPLTSQRTKLEELLERCFELKDLIKVERYEVRKMLGEARKFVDSNPSDFHSAEVEKITISANSKLQNIWNILSESEKIVRDALNSGLDEPKLTMAKKSEYLDRYSDSTIEDKLAGRDGGIAGAVSDEPEKKIMEPMRELLKSEKDYIDDLCRCVEVYLYAYKTAGSMCPLAIRGKEREIFGNIDELFQFHSTIFLSELSAYERNPEDVGYCFIAWMEKLKELYADYCLNKEENNFLICLPEAISMFSEIREQNNLEPCHDLQSLVIKPVQRITKYHILLKELLKHSTKNTKELKNAYNIVTTIPKLANDRMHLKCFENSQEYNVGDFVMQDTFIVSEPKRYFKRERELQVFLFESNIVFAKREELSSKKSGYVYKDSMLLREIHVVEHVEADNTKFGLRRSAFPYQNDQNTTVLKANTEAQRILWVKTLRDLKIDIGRQKSSIDGSTSSNRASRDSQSSLILQSMNNQIFEDGQFSDGNGFNTPTTVIMRERGGQQDSQMVANKERRILVATENFTASRPDQMSVQLGQKVEMLPQNALVEADNSSAEFIKVATVMDNVGQKTATTIGWVPRRILAPLQSSSTNPDAEASTSQTNDEPASSMSNKRTSFRRFFTSNQKPELSKNNTAREHRPSSGNIAAADRPGSSSALRPEDNQPQPSCSSVLSPLTSHHPSNTASSTTAFSLQQPQPIPSTSSTATGAATDLDLPPPMNQIGSSAVMAEAGEENANGTTMSEEQNNNTAGGALAESSSSSQQQEQQRAAGPPIEQMSAEESARLKRSYVLQELVETERAYVLDLASIVEGYISTLREMELSDEDREKVKIIFANIEQILDFHKSFFCKEIEKSLQDYEAAGNAFIKYERRLHTFYVKYCQNKPKSDFLVSQDYFEQLFADVKDKLGHKVALSDLLIKPVQRITKYQLMLSDILKYTHRAKDRADILERAHDVMRVVPKACDDMMQVGRLQGFQGNLNAQGRLIFQGTLSISDGGISQPFKGKDRRVFLFEQSVIIAECIPPRKEYGNPTYNFKNQIMVNKMQLEEQVADEPYRFVLQSNDPNQPATYVAQATSADEKSQWLSKLSAQLDQQKTFLAALVDPKRYQNQLANSMGSMNIGGKKDSSGSLGTPTSPAATSALGGGISPTKQTATQKSSSKLFGFGKQKS